MTVLPRGSQKGIYGQVVNVPADIISTVTQLPRTLENSGIVSVKLKRKRFTPIL